ncbi:MAG: DUF6473 family protein [Roseovarius sp.]
MAYEKLDGASLDYDPCQYPGSKLLFRGPKRSLETPYVAFLGGTETYGKFIADPYVSLVEAELGMPCVNFGWSNAGVDVFLNDKGVLRAARDAQAVVLQLPGAQNMSNRFYAVHPRRNDRFVKPRELMLQIFPEVDFSEFHFTRHMLNHLRRRAPSRFATVRNELQTLWVARMRLLLMQLNGRVIMLYFSKREPDQHSDSPDIGVDPAFVTEAMIDEIRQEGAEVIEVCETPEAAAAGTDGMVCSSVELAAANELLGPIAHQDAARALVAPLRYMLA